MNFKKNNICKMLFVCAFAVLVFSGVPSGEKKSSPADGLEAHDAGRLSSDAKRKHFELKLRRQHTC